MASTTRLSSKFLLTTIPTMVVAALLFVFGAYVLKLGDRADLNRQLAEQRAAANASLLSYPVWNVDEVTVAAIMRSLSGVPGLVCVELDQLVGLQAPPAVGSCQDRQANVLIEVPVQFSDRGSVQELGRLRHWFDLQPDAAEVWRDLWPLLFQLVLLVMVLMVSAIWAFRRTVLNPLDQVAGSLRVFRETGRREPAVCSSNDELGEFIREYNNGLARQEHAERGLREQLLLQTSLNQTMPTPFAFLDNEFKLISANQAFYQQLGLAHEIDGRSMLATLPAIDWPSIAALVAGEVHRQELHGLVVRGRSRGFSLACSAMLDPVADALRGYVLVLQDISDLLDHERALRAAKDRSEATLAELHRTQASLVQAEKLAALGSLVAGVAHEINTPLGASVTVVSHLRSLLEGLDQQFNREQLRRSVLADFLQQANEGLALLQRSLDSANEQVRRFKQSAVDQVSAQQRAFELGELIGDVVATLRSQWRNSAQRIEYEVPPGIVLDSTPGPLEQVISNCVSNAFVHAFDADQDGVVRIRAERMAGDWVRMVIADNGCGMSADRVRRVFDPFFTTKLGRGGNGLGMHLAYQLVSDVLHGRISVESQPGQGTRVIIDLPLSLRAVVTN
ncbi:sensor histidine kinase [Pseudomarimonas arenosa]|uniref:histidine kinase n=1 Tax=Pseudomarimonas arenosa TaxID=2774145 RepID=A0AAW3ZJI0_9GAMM|nr:PAS domain-containing sensor histidine kinase [Pseudomarimonas arenosa]MBD8526138.1 HAMP domain-containing histidine kinase [Pseudomarimonas arenosa]